MKVPESELTGETGVALVKALVNGQLGWLFRSQLESDVGVDAQVEVVEDGMATGQLVALQIKSGKSFFDESTADGFVFRPKEKHVRYWLGHCLPVAVILVDVDEQTAYWQIVTEETVSPTEKGWKMTVPMGNTLSESSGPELAAASEPAAGPELTAASEGDAYTLKLRQLQLARPWMEHLVNGGSLAVEFEEWVNKSSGRASLCLISRDESGTVADSHEWPCILLPGADYAVELPRMFPWATLTRDAEADWEQYASECAIWDNEDEDFLYTSTYDEWLSNRVDAGGGDGGEVAHWRLDLVLSDMGRAFLTVDDHLSNEVIHGLFPG